MRRGHPRLWDHDYLHLRPLSRDLDARIPAVASGARVLDVGAGPSPYRDRCGEALYVRLDLAASARPEIVGRAESLPFRDGAFDLVLSTQLLGLVQDPWAFGREAARVVRRGGSVLVSGPAGWPYDSASPEHRFGEPDLPRLFPGLVVTEIVRQGGMLALPFALFNVGVREAVRSAERRFGAAAALRPLARALYAASNLSGRLLERLAAAGPLASFLGYLDRRLPMNWLVVAERER